VAARIDGRRITYQPGFAEGQQQRRLQLRVDGKLITPGQRDFVLGPNSRIVSTSGGEGIDVSSPDGTRLVISSNWWPSQGMWYMNVDVINTQASNAIVGAIPFGDWLPPLPDGSWMGPMPTSLTQRYADLYRKFTDSWRVTETTSLFDYAPGTNPKTFVVDWPPEPPPCFVPGSINPPAKGMDQRAAEKYCRTIEDKNMYAQCVFDVAATGEPGFAELYRRTQQRRLQR
jgi:hypothetical protein